MFSSYFIKIGTVSNGNGESKRPFQFVIGAASRYGSGSGSTKPLFAAPAPQHFLGCIKYSSNE
jgi:hypothetical protein